MLICRLTLAPVDSFHHYVTFLGILAVFTGPGSVVFAMFLVVFKALTQLMGTNYNFYDIILPVISFWPCRLCHLSVLAALYPDNLRKDEVLKQFLSLLLLVLKIMKRNTLTLLKHIFI